MVMARGKGRVNLNSALSGNLQSLLDGLQDELMVVDGEYRVKFANAVICGRLRDETKSPVDRLCYEAFHHRDSPCCAPIWDCPLKQVLQRGNATTFMHYERTQGASRYLKISAYPLRDSQGNIEFVAELRRDISAQRELETNILRRHHQLLALNRISNAVCSLRNLDTILKVGLNNVLDIISGAIGGILILDERSRTLSYRVQHGLSAAYTEGMTIPIGEGIAGKVAQSGEPVLLEDVSKVPDVACPDLVSAEGLKGFISIPIKARDKIVGVMNVASHEAGRFGADDLSLLNSIGDYLGTAIEQVRLYEGLRLGRERYQRLLRHALTAQEEERKRIARELHDETSQAITSLTLSLQAIIGMAELKGIDDSEFIAKLKATHANAVRAGNEVVKLMKELRPTLLDELGLPAAIHRYAKDTLQTQGVNVSTEFKGMEQRMRPEVEVTLFRIAQGAIGNILEHAKAKNASINLECDDNECVLHIEDDGKGFDVNKLTRVDPKGRGAGLFTMKERVGLVGGACHIESSPGRGTRVIVEIPVLKDADEED
jgi:signal transduction histidine kinase